MELDNNIMLGTDLFFNFDIDERFSHQQWRPGEGKWHHFENVDGKKKTCV